MLFLCSCLKTSIPEAILSEISRSLQCRSLIRRTPLSGCGKGSTLLLTWTWPPSCIHSYCPPGLSLPNFKVAGKVTRIWVGCPREIYCLWVVIIMATGNIKTVYDIFQSMESGPTATPTYPIAQVNLLISLAIKAWFNCPKVMLWCMLGMFGHFFR